MILLGGFLVCLATSLGLWATGRGVFTRELFLRENYRGVRVPTGVGVLIAVAPVFGQAVLSLAEAVGGEVDAAALESGRLTVAAVLGFSLLGLVDDVAVDRGVSGYRGHVRALLGGRITGGGLKLVAGAALSVVVVAPIAADTAVQMVLDAALVALAANLANLFDRAPGRVTKVGLTGAAVILVTAGAAPELLGAAMVVGAAVGLLVPDLREQLMLGDAGANALGGALGLAVVLAYAEEVRFAVLVAVLVLNLLSEVVSFSSVIEATPPLRWLDRLGRRSGPSDGPAGQLGAG